jgi:hypothetical protein
LSSNGTRTSNELAIANLSAFKRISFGIHWVDYLQPEYQQSPTIKDIVDVHYEKVQDMSEIKKMQN